MIDLKIDSRLFESETLSFKVRASDPRARDLVEDGSLEHDGRRYFIKEVTDTLDENGIALKGVEAEIGWMRLADIRRIASFEIEDRTAKEGLTAILKGTTWSVGSVMPTDDFFLESTDSTVLSLIWDWCRIVGGEPTFDTLAKTVNISLVAGANRGLSFRYGRNIRSIKRTSTPPTATRVYGWGRNDLRMSVGPYLEDYSWYVSQGISLEDAKSDYRKDDVIVDDAITSAAVLTRVVTAHLAVTSKPTITYEAKVVDLSTLSGLPEDQFAVGDFAQVYDEIVGTELTARVSRRVQNPLEPFKDEVELAFNNVLMPTSANSGARTSPSLTWELYKSDNTGPRKVRLGDTLLGRLKLKYTPNAEYVLGYSLAGVAHGNSTLTLEFTDDETDLPYWKTETFALSAGQPFRFNFTRAVRELEVNQETLVVRANTDSAGSGLDIDERLSNLWVLARGTTLDDVTLENSIRYNYTGKIQTFEVPDDVSEILVEAHGSAGQGNIFSPGGKGGIVIASIPVVAGDIYNVYVPGAFDVVGDPNGAWPNGGAGIHLNNLGKGGGGAAYLVPQALDLGIGITTNAIIVAPGGGGGSDTFFAPGPGGDGGFYDGGDGYGGGFAGPNTGSGANQYGPGVGPPLSSHQAGDVRGHGMGGSGGFLGDIAAAEGGGGGGGWHGGASGNRDASAGGGGSGWITPSAWDLETFDGAETALSGWIVISWDDPLPL